MSNVVTLLSELSPSSRARALVWINDFFSSEGRDGEALRALGGGALGGECAPAPADGTHEAAVAKAEHFGAKAVGQEAAGMGSGAPAIDVPVNGREVPAVDAQEADGEVTGVDAPERVHGSSPSYEVGAAGREADALEGDAGSDDSQAEREDEWFESFAELYELVAPRTARQKVATAAWWLEECEGRRSWKSSDVSGILDEIERPLRYISTTIAHERQREDPLVERIAGSDGSMGGQGKFHLSQFGRAFVEARVYE